MSKLILWTLLLAGGAFLVLGLSHTSRVDLPYAQLHLLEQAGKQALGYTRIAIYDLRHIPQFQGELRLLLQQHLLDPLNRTLNH
jgi:hypothetical protein